MPSKFLLSIVAILLVIQCRAANYYFAANGNDANTTAQAQVKTTPWATITKLNSFFASLKPGDSVLFRRGDTFTGTITVAVSGTAALPIVIAAYGTGANPIISGMVPVTGWTSVGTNIYQGSCPGAGTTVNVVMLNGVPQAIGRWPNLNAANGGYLNVDSHVTDTQITSSALNTAVNWAGAEVVIRKNHWILDRGTISSNTATVINYTDASPYSPTNNFGFFIQNSPNTLDQQGEWYFNPTAKTLQIYTTTAPTNTSVTVSSTAYLVTSASKSYITFSGITFIGANSWIFNINTATGFTIKNCVLNGAGQNGVKAVTTTRLIVDHTTIKNVNNLGISNTAASYSQFTNDTVMNVGSIGGMGLSGDGTYEGIQMNGKSALITNNYVANIGYDGIDFSQGDSTIVKNNYVKNFEMVKDDGGGIYTYAAQVDSNTNFYGLQIVNNIVESSGAGPTYGVPGTGPSYAAGIYLDANCTGITISGNSVSGSLSGLFIHESRNIIISNNTLFNNGAQLYFSHNTTNFATKNNTTSGNIIYSKYSTQITLGMITLNVGVQTFSTFNNNYYNSSINNIFNISANGKWLNLALWQYLYNRDLTSTDLPKIPAWTVVMPSKRSLFTNSTFTSNVTNALTWSAAGNFVGAWDNTNVLDGGSFKTSFSSQSGSASNNPSMQFKVGAVTAGTVYMLKFSLKSTHAKRRVMVSLQNNASPYNGLTPLQYFTLDSVRAENTIMITPTAACASTIVVLRLENEDVTTYVDNFGFYATTSTAIDPSTQIVYKTNPSTTAISIPLAGSYYDAKGVKYTGNATVPAYGSVLLFKRSDTSVTAPPVIYTAPNASKDYIAFSSVQKNPINVSVYPNPASDYIMINFNNSDSKDLTIRLMNTAGDVIMNQQVQVSDSNYRLDLTQKPKPGCYFLQVTGSGFTQTSKVIII